MRRKIARTVGYSILLRIFFSLIGKRGKIMQVLREPVYVLQFGWATGTFVLIFNLIRRFFANQRKKQPQPEGKEQKNKWLSKEFETIIACCAASFGIS